MTCLSPIIRPCRHLNQVRRQAMAGLPGPVFVGAGQIYYRPAFVCVRLWLKSLSFFCHRQLQDWLAATYRHPYRRPFGLKTTFATRRRIFMDCRPLTGNP
jgi:hypothetical protein